MHNVGTSKLDNTRKCLPHCAARFLDTLFLCFQACVGVVVGVVPTWCVLVYLLTRGVETHQDGKKQDVECITR